MAPASQKSTESPKKSQGSSTQDKPKKSVKKDAPPAGGDIRNFVRPPSDRLYLALIRSLDQVVLVYVHAPVLLDPHLSHHQNPTRVPARSRYRSVSDVPSMVTDLSDDSDEDGAGPVYVQVLFNRRSGSCQTNY